MLFIFVFNPYGIDCLTVSEQADLSAADLSAGWYFPLSSALKTRKTLPG
jgi:hypothetical protein